MTGAALLTLVLLAQSARAAYGPFPAPAAPPGLHVELRTAGDRHTFRFSERIPLEVAFQSSKARTYSVELADGWNWVPEQDRFLVEPGDAAIDRAWPGRGIICCDRMRPFVHAEPTTHPLELTDFVRFTTPGEYRVQYLTRRIFTGPSNDRDKPGDLIVRSNVLTVTIVDDDAQWLRDTLRHTLKALEVEPTAEQWLAFREPPSARLPKDAATIHYIESEKALRLLDTPEAIRARVAHIQVPSVEEWRRDHAGGGHQFGWETALVLSSRPDLVAAAMLSRASAAAFPVTEGYAEIWSRVLVERDHPEEFRLEAHDDPRSPRRYQRYLDSAPRERARRDLLEILQTLRSRKTGGAAEITAATIAALESELAKPK